MHRIAWLALLAFTACAADEAADPLADVAGRWEAEAVDPAVTDVLELDAEGNGTAQLFRYAATLMRVDADVVAEPTEDPTRFELSLRCNGRTFGCERHDFDATCMLGGDELLCDAPEWYHDPNWIELHAVED